jgi:hypothetical protein
VIPPRPPAQLAGWRGGPAIDLKTFVVKRSESLMAQLAGETEGYSPGAPRRLPAPPPGGLKANAAYGNLPLMALAVMRGADGNYDGKLSRGEVIAAIRDFFAEADTARQNALDRMRLATAIARAMQRGGALGRPDRGDRGGPRNPQRQQDPALWAGAILRAIDGKAERVTLQQLLSAGEKAFALADKDKSGTIDADEMLVLLDALAASAPPGSVAAGPAEKSDNKSN